MGGATVLVKCKQRKFREVEIVPRIRFVVGRIAIAFVWLGIGLVVDVDRVPFFGDRISTRESSPFPISLRIVLGSFNAFRFITLVLYLSRSFLFPLS